MKKIKDFVAEGHENMWECFGVTEQRHDEIVNALAKLRTPNIRGRELLRSIDLDIKKGEEPYVFFLAGTIVGAAHTPMLDLERYVQTHDTDDFFAAFGIDDSRHSRMIETIENTFREDKVSKQIVKAVERFKPKNIAELSLLAFTMGRRSVIAIPASMGDIREILKSKVKESLGKKGKDYTPLWGTPKGEA